MAQAQAPRKPVEGFLDNKKFLHPKFAANYGNWKYHDRPRPGVLHHVSNTGDEVWSTDEAHSSSSTAPSPRSR